MTFRRQQQDRRGLTAPARPAEPLRDRIRCHVQSAGRPRGSSRVDDLVLEPPARHIVPAPAGTLLDDHFTAEDRDAIDREALSRLDAWRREHDAPLTVGNACLPWIWETELLAEVYLPVVPGGVGPYFGCSSDRRSATSSWSGRTAR